MPLNSILYVEDDADIRTIATLSLETLGGFNLTIAEDGFQALEALKTLKPDLILLDVMMPGMDGPETLQNIRKQSALASIPVMFMTAKVQPNEIEEYFALGAIGVIPKPFDPMTLADQIKQLWQDKGPSE